MFLFRSEMAKHLKSQCYSLVMGFNLFGSLVMSAIMTFFFVQFNFMDITVPGRVRQNFNTTQCVFILFHISVL